MYTREFISSWLDFFSYLINLYTWNLCYKRMRESNHVSDVRSWPGSKYALESITCFLKNDLFRPAQHVCFQCLGFLQHHSMMSTILKIKKTIRWFKPGPFSYDNACVSSVCKLPNWLRDQFAWNVKKLKHFGSVQFVFMLIRVDTKVVKLIRND